MLNKKILGAILAGLVQTNLAIESYGREKESSVVAEASDNLETMSLAGSNINYKIIIDIESRGNPKAISPCGARGLMGIMPCTLKEWNQAHPKQKYNFDQMFNPEINVQVGRWYLEQRVPFFLKYFKIEDTIEHRIASYNCGIGRLKAEEDHGKILPKETRNYFVKYEKRAGKSYSNSTKK
jgi:soluble lytic murein transglycosylase-like protein